MRILAIDPGETHCGMAYFEDDDDAWHVVSSWEERPEECFNTAYRFMTEEGLDVLVVEEFRLFPWKSQQQGFSQLKTVETIGVLRYLHRRACELIEASNNVKSNVGKWSEPQTLPKWIEQGSSILKPTRAICKAKGIRRVRGSNDHEASAQIHGWYYILKVLEGEEIGT